MDAPSSDAAEIAALPEVLYPNIWPSEDMPELEPAFKTLARLIVDTAVLLARHCDKYSSLFFSLSLSIFFYGSSTSVCVCCLSFCVSLTPCPSLSFAHSHMYRVYTVKKAVPTYQENKISNIISTSRHMKARLLYYFPPRTMETDVDETDPASWCGWHHEVGCLHTLYYF